VIPDSQDTYVEHPVWGKGCLVRKEGTDWIIKFEFHRGNIRLRYEDRSMLKIIPSLLPVQQSNDSPVSLSPSGVNRLFASLRKLPPVQGPVKAKLKPAKKTKQKGSFVTWVPPIDKLELDQGIQTSPLTPSTLEIDFSSTTVLLARSDGRDFAKIRAVESLANGLPPSGEYGRTLAVDFDHTSSMINVFLKDVDIDGGCALIVKGGYGQGKTLSLRCLEEVALENRFVVTRTEVDATENRLNKPHHIYRDFMRHIRVPGCSGVGATTLADAASKAIHSAIGEKSCVFRQQWLAKHLECDSLAWLLSHNQFASREKFVGLLAGDPQYRADSVRRSHTLEASPRIWPMFSAATQGDFGCYLLSGIGRLARLMGMKGLIIIMDEMEKWQDLNWKEQTQAGNLLGGLIWGATESKNRSRKDTYPGNRDRYPGNLEHSKRCGGYPFTTPSRTHIGLAIAMTPRSEEDDPVSEWERFGPILDVDLPRLSVDKLKRYVRRLVPIYCTAYGVRILDADEISEIIEATINIWQKEGEMTNRAAVQCAVATLHKWRDRTMFSEQLSDT